MADDIHKKNCNNAMQIFRRNTHVIRT